MNNIFWKPIVSMYCGFTTREIIYQNWFGKRIVKKVYAPFSTDFPIQTDFIDHKTFQRILDGAKYIRMGTMIFLEETINHQSS